MASLDGDASRVSAQPFDRASRLSGARAMLPSYMVPSVVMGIDEWPRTSSGKIDRKRLPSVVDACTGMCADGAIPTSMRRRRARCSRRYCHELWMRSAWRRASSSSAAWRLRWRLRAVCATRSAGRVSVADVLQRPTIAALSGSDGEDESASLTALERSVDGARLLAHAYVVSWNQSQLLTVHVVDGATAAYNIPMTHWVDGSHSAWSVGVALGVVMDRHAVLRTTYEVDAAGGFEQRARTCMQAVVGVRGRSACHEVCVSSEAAADGIVGARTRRVASSCCLPTVVACCSLVRVVGLGSFGSSGHAAARRTCTTWRLTARRRACLSASFGAAHESLQRSNGDSSCTMLPRVVLQYVDYALWQRSEALAPQLASSVVLALGFARGRSAGARAAARLSASGGADVCGRRGTGARGR